MQAKITLVHKDGAMPEFITDEGSSYGVTAIGYTFVSRGKRYLVHPKSVRMIIDEEVK